MAEKKIPAVVKAFEDFAIFCNTRWRAALIGVIFIAVLGALFLLLYFGYRKIELLGTGIEKSVEMLEQTHSTPASLQEGLVDSVHQNLLIEKELALALVSSKNAVSAIFFKFHNSKTDLQGKHDFFYSAMNEITKSKELAFLTGAQSLPITGLGQYMVPFIEHKCQTVTTNEIEGNNWLKGKLEKDKITQISSCPIYDISDKYLLGFVELVYTGGDNQIRPTYLVEDCLSDTARRLTTIISN